MKLEKFMERKLRAFYREFNAKYLYKWLFLAVMTGTVVGVFAIVFFELVELAYDVLLGSVGFYPPLAGGEAAHRVESVHTSWLLALVPMIGGLLAGLTVYLFAPEAKGCGVDSVIKSFHKLRGRIRPSVPFVKSVAAAFTIGSGGSAGREGPIAQIGAGMGSIIGRILKLSEEDRHMLLICGMAAGVGSIFKAPLGGALFAISVLYTRDHEVKGLVPAVISAITAYSVFSLFFGFGPIFTTPHYSFSNPTELIFYTGLAVVCGLVAVLYIETLDWVKRFFNNIKIPFYMKPAIGGLGVGLIALYFPQVMGGGYGWIQKAIDGELVITAMVLIVLAKILATAFTSSSGGSGGLFAPSLVIGAMLGGAFGQYFASLFPNVITEPSAFVLVGMAAFFAAAAKIPIVNLILVSEMTGSYALLPPLMLTETIAYVISGRHTLYKEQVPTRADSPTHRHELSADILEGIKVSEAMNRRPKTVKPTDSIDDILELISKTGYLSFPILDDRKKLAGMITFKDIVRLELEETEPAQKAVKRNMTIHPTDSIEKVMKLNEDTGKPTYPILKGDKLLGTFTFKDVARITKEGKIRLEDAIEPKVFSVNPDDSLYHALYEIVSHKLEALPVVSKGDSTKLVGIISKTDIMKTYVNFEAQTKRKKSS